MRKIILIKHYPSLQLGHLYEHLFCAQLKQLFYKNNLFKYLDFSLDGTTFDHGGLIEISLELYTSKAVAFAEEIAKQKISFDKEDVIGAYIELLAEEEQPISSRGYDIVLQELKKLDKKPWQDVETFDVFDAKTVRRKPYPIYISEGKELPSRKVTTKLHLEPGFAKTRRELIPLFRQMAKVIAFTASDQLAMKNSYYCGDMDFISKPREIYMKSLLQVANGNEESVDVTRDARDYQQVATYIASSKSFGRLFDELRSTSYRNQPWTAPGTYHSFDETAVYIGVSGWRRVATEENLELLLKNMLIEVKFGHQKVSAPPFELS